MKFLKLLTIYLTVVAQTWANLPPTTMKGQAEASKVTTFNFEVPANQAVTTSNSTRLIQTGDFNELANGDFEHATVTTSWTISNATGSADTTNMISGKKALSLSLSGALSISQVSTINAAQKSQVQMLAFIMVKSSIADLQLCSMVNGAEDKCTAVGGYAGGNVWRPLKVAFLSGTTSNGLKLKSTTTSGTVLVDAAYVGISDPLVDFNPDMVYSAKVSNSGVVSDENVDWLSGNCSLSTATFTCTFTSNIFTVAPNCTLTTNQGSAVIPFFNTPASSTGFAVRTLTTNTVTDIAVAFVVTCEKTGADYKSSRAYVASGSKLLNTTVFSAEVSSTGVVSNENVDWLNGNCTNASPAVCTFNTNIFTVAPNCTMTPNSNTADMGGFNAFSSTGFSVQFNLNNKYVFRVVCQKQGADYEAAFNPVIVGSFQGYNETPGTSRVETFSVAYGTTNVSTVCSGTPCFIQQIGNATTSITRSGAGSYSLNLARTYSGLICSLTPIQNTTNAVAIRAAPLACTNCNTLTFTTGVKGSTNLDTYGTLTCQGTL